MYVVSHSKGIFYCSRGPGKGCRNVKWNKLQGGDWDIPQSAKQNISAAEKHNLCSLFTSVTCWCWKHGKGRWPRTLLLFTFHQKRVERILQISAPSSSVESGQPHQDLSNGDLGNPNPKNLRARAFGTEVQRLLYSSMQGRCFWDKTMVH